MDRRAPIVVAFLLCAGSAPAQVDESCLDSLCESPRYSAFVRTRVGRGIGPFFSDNLPEARSAFTQAVSFLFGGELALTPTLSVGARVSAAPSTIEQPGGSYLDEKTWGSPELYVATPVPAFALGNMKVHLRARAAIGIPVAGHDSRLARNRVVAVSAAMEGGRNPELHTPGVLPVTGLLSAATRAGPLWLRADLKLPLMFRLHDSDLRSERTQAFGFVPHIALGGSYWPTHWLGLRTTLSGVLEAVQPATHKQGRGQLGLETGLLFALGEAWQVGLDSYFALAGPLENTLGLGLGLSYSR